MKKYGIGIVVMLIVVAGGMMVVHAADKSAEAPALMRATLVANDFLEHTLSFESGSPGGVMCGREVCNFDSDLDFGVRRSNGFTVGIQGGQSGAIVDCGHWSDLAAEYGYQETVGGGQGFNSIRFENDELVILADLQTQEVQSFTHGNDFLEIDPQGSDSAPGRLGHVYLVHLIDDNNPLEDVVVKFLVVSGRKNDHATIIWEVLER